MEWLDLAFADDLFPDASPGLDFSSFDGLAGLANDNDDEGEGQGARPSGEPHARKSAAAERRESEARDKFTRLRALAERAATKTVAPLLDPRSCHEPILTAILAC